MNSEITNFLVASFYCFSSINKPEILVNKIKKVCNSLRLRGTIILSVEGINGTVAGHPKGIKANMDFLKEQGFHNLNTKFSESIEMPFYRMKVKIKKEIISMLNNPIDTDSERGTLIDAKNWNDVIAQDDVILIDTRNEYETSIGTFQNSILPQIQSFQDFKAYIDTELIHYKDKKIAMFCTGGIRCEKASAYLKHHGFSDIYQLDGGIIEYTHQIKKYNLNSKFKGNNFVFDGRMNESISNDIISLCHQCDSPSSDHTNCNNQACHILFIQCQICYRKYEGCCSVECKTIYRLPIDEQRKLRKKPNLAAPLKQYQQSVKPKLKDLIQEKNKLK